MAVGMVGLYLASIILLVAGPIALDQIKWKFFLVLIIPTGLHFLNVYFFFPETKQRSLEDINLAFGEQVAVRYYGASEADEQIYAEAQKEEDRIHHVETTTTSLDDKVGIVHHVEKV